MGTDIYAFGEKKTDDGWECVLERVFRWRSYDLFGFLADVRNYSAVTPIHENQYVEDSVSFPIHSRFFVRDTGIWTAFMSDEQIEEEAKAQVRRWGLRWLAVEDLLKHDYDQIIEDRRKGSDLDTCEAGQGIKIPLREFLGESYFSELDRIRASGADRLVFWFD